MSSSSSLALQPEVSEAEVVAISQRGGLLYTPHVCDKHRPLAVVPQREVELLIEERIITPCHGEEIYTLGGHGAATFCSDPSLFEAKSGVINHRGQFAVFSLPGIGLRFDPESPIYDPKMLDEVKRFLAATKSHFDLGQAFVINAHYPCGYAKGKDGSSLTLRQTIDYVAGGARAIKEALGIKVIATIFITIAQSDDNMRLGWYHVKKNFVQGCGA